MSARNNPFRTDRLEALPYIPEDWTWGGFLAKLEGMGYRAAIVGAKGTGKTTLMRELVPRLKERGFRARCLQLRASKRGLTPGVERHLLATLTMRDIVLLDGAEQFSTWRWMRFCHLTRRAAGLIVTTHRPGRLPTIVVTKPSASLLGDLVNRLAPGATWSADELRTLHEQHGGNIRETLRDLYDRTTRREGIDQVTTKERNP